MPCHSFIFRIPWWFFPVSSFLLLMVLFPSSAENSPPLRKIFCNCLSNPIKMYFYCDHFIHQHILRIWLRTFKLSAASFTWRIMTDNSNAIKLGPQFNHLNPIDQNVLIVSPQEHRFSKSQSGLLGTSGGEEARAEDTLMLRLFKFTLARQFQLSWRI